MRTKTLLALGSALAFWLVGAKVSGAQVAAEPPRMTLTAEVVGRKYCEINPGATSLQMRLRLRYTNAGRRKLILYKGHDLFYQTIFRRPAAAGARPYEVTALHSSYFEAGFEAIDQPSPGRVFVILNPGGTYERELEVNVGVVDDESRRGNHAIAEGEHRLSLVVSTWYKSRPLAQELRRRWERKGVLWFDPLASAPLNLTVKKPDARTPCG